MIYIRYLTLLAIWLVACTDPPSGVPLYTFGITDPEGHTVLIHSDSYDPDEVITVQANTQYDFFLRAAYPRDFQKISFALPVHQTIRSNVNCTYPSNLGQMVVNTGNPYLYARNYYHNSADIRGPTNLNMILINGVFKAEYRSFTFDFFVELEALSTSGSVERSVNHLIHFRTE